MKQKKETCYRVFALALLVAVAGAPQLTLLRQVNAQDLSRRSPHVSDLREKGKASITANYSETTTKEVSL